MQQRFKEENSMLTATIFDIERNSFVDGPGIRTTVFFKGCPLTCVWCHNPEGLDPRPQIMVKDSRCVHCGKCFLPCTHDICKKFGRCIYACPESLISVSGKEWDSAELAQKLSLTVEQIAFKAGMLVCAIFPILGTLLVLCIMRYFKKNRIT